MIHSSNVAHTSFYLFEIGSIMLASWITHLVHMLHLNPLSKADKVGDQFQTSPD